MKLLITLSLLSVPLLGMDKEEFELYIGRIVPEKVIQEKTGLKLSTVKDLNRNVGRDASFIYRSLMGDSKVNELYEKYGKNSK